MSSLSLGPRVRWFIAEFMIVLSGVLVALAVQASYQKSDDQGRERDYLKQIVSELRTTEADLVKQIAYGDTLVQRAKKAHAAFFLKQTPSVDSVDAWWKFDHASPDLTLGTLRAVTANGDIRLIHNDSARAAIVWISERSRYYDERLRKWELVIVNSDNFHHKIRARLALDANARGVSADDTHGEGSAAADAAGVLAIPRDPREPPFVPQLAAYFNDPEAYSAIRTYMSGSVAHLSNMRRLLVDIKTARKKIETHTD